MITDNLTARVFFSGLMPKKCPILNGRIAEILTEKSVPFAYLSETKDIWCRDFMPIQIENDRFVFYKYKPDYLQDKTGLRLQTNPENVFHASANRIENLMQNAITIDLVLDGGNVVKCGDTVVITEKVFFENKDKTRDQVEGILKDAFRSDILFLPWDRNETFGHSDGIVHYAGDGKILLTNYDDFSPYYYNRFRKALGKRFEVIPLKYKAKRPHATSWAYINFLQIGKLVLVPQLGIEEDEQALEQINNALPDCEVVGVPAREAVRRGGALNCISWNVTLQDGIIDNSVERKDFYMKFKVNEAIIKQIQNQRELFEKGLKYEENGDYENAVELYTESARLGYDWAQFTLAMCYENGNGVEKDLAKAVEWYTKAAEQENIRAQHNLAICYEEGSGIRKNMRKAIIWYREAAELGFAPSQYNLAVCYEEGRGTKKNPKKAFEWYAKAAEQGISFAQYKLAVCYRKGFGVEKDLKEAVKWYTKAAKQEDPYAQNDLGSCYENGDGVEKDLKKALTWYRKATKQGDDTAQLNLGNCYEKGLGVKKNLEKAKAWYKLSAEKGNKNALNKLFAL